MTREQIERAAGEYSGSVLGFKDNPVVMNNHKAFMDGAQWRINSVWHSTDELPKYSGFLAVLMSNGLMEIMYYSAGIGFHEMTLKGYVLWAYISDLLPERKEETNGGR